jgi:transketolase
MLDPVLAATTGLDVTVAYTNTVRPLDLAGLRNLAATNAVVLVEPYLAGTSTRLIDEALADRAHRILALGVDRAEQRRYGTPEHHDVLHGLDTAGLQYSITKFLTGS